MANEESQTDFARRMYDQRAPTYDDSFHPALALKMLDLISLKPGHKTLDLACGTGLMTFPTAARVAHSGHVFGVDVSEGMLAKAHARLSELKRRTPAEAAIIDFISGDIVRLDQLHELKHNSFDFITCCSAFVLLEDPEAAINQWTQYLKPGTGCILVDVPHPMNFRHGMVIEQAARQLGLPVPYHRAWVTNDKSLRELLERSGLVVEKYEQIEPVGYGINLYDKDQGGDIFDKNVASEPYKTLLREDGNRETVRNEFIKHWEAAANEEGKVEEVDGLWVAVARRKA